MSDKILIAGIEVPISEPPPEAQHLVPADEPYEPVSDEFLGLAIAKTFHRHLRLIGPAGAGKNGVIRKFCYLTNTPLITLSIAEGTGIDQLIGSVQPAGDGQGGLTTEWYDGALPLALRLGACLTLDEGNAADPRLFMRVHDFLATGDRLHIFEDPRSDGQFRTPFDEKGNHNGFFIVMTMNPSDDGQYSGTQEMNAATLDRLITVEMDYIGIYDPDAEADILVLNTGIDKRLAQRIVKVFNIVRRESRLSDKEMAQANSKPIYATASVRRALDVADFSRFLPLMKAWELGYLNGINRDDRPVVAKFVLDEFAGE